MSVSLHSFMTTQPARELLISLMAGALAGSGADLANHEQCSTYLKRDYRDMDVDAFIEQVITEAKTLRGVN